jgi:4-hydroxy-tetrahydrodipicolinate synthase
MQMMDVINRAPKDFSILVGDDSLTLPFMGIGGDGVISVLSNAMPKTMSTFINHCLKGEFETAKKMFYQIFELTKGIFIESNPTPIKEILSIMGYCDPSVRLPLARATEKSMVEIHKMVEQIKGIEK